MGTKKPESFSERLRRIIAECGWSRYELSKRSGVTQAALSRFANGQRGLTTESIDRLAEALGLELTVRPPAKRRGKKGR